MYQKCNSSALQAPNLPRASICILTFNAGNYLRPQLDSVINQLKENDEIVIVDNSSSDETRSVINEFMNSQIRIRVVYLNKNLGISKGFELCLALALGKFIFLCDQDDIWLPTRLEKQIASLDYSDLSICNATLVDEALNPLGRNTFDLRFPILGWRNLYKNAFIGCTMAMTRDTAHRMIPFPDAIPMHDWYIAQIAHQTKLRLALIPEVLHLYRRHGRTASGTGAASKRSILQKIIDRIKLIRYTFRGI